MIEFDNWLSEEAYGCHALYGDGYVIGLCSKDGGDSWRLIEYNANEFYKSDPDLIQLQMYGPASGREPLMVDIDRAHLRATEIMLKMLQHEDGFEAFDDLYEYDKANSEDTGISKNGVEWEIFSIDSFFSNAGEDYILESTADSVIADAERGRIWIYEGADAIADYLAERKTREPTS